MGENRPYDFVCRLYVLLRSDDKKMQRTDSTIVWLDRTHTLSRLVVTLPIIHS